MISAIYISRILKRCLRLVLLCCTCSSFLQQPEPAGKREIGCSILGNVVFTNSLAGQTNLKQMSARVLARLQNDSKVGPESRESPHLETLRSRILMVVTPLLDV